jgi:hypothetical protein
MKCGLQPASIVPASVAVPATTAKQKDEQHDDKNGFHLCDSNVPNQRANWQLSSIGTAAAARLLAYSSDDTASVTNSELHAARLVAGFFASSEITLSRTGPQSAHS